MIGETFLSYRRFRWLWLNLAALSLLVLLFVLNRPVGGRNGATVIGYTYGSIATAGILYLMWYGRRKRAHYAQYTTLRGCLAAHAWLGIALALVVPLHSGFEFGWNVHTLAYGLMMATILSGLLGAWIYIRFPARVMVHRGGGSIRSRLAQIADLSQDIQFLSRERSDQYLELYDRLAFQYQPSMIDCLVGKRPPEIPPRELAALMSKLPSEESDESLQLVTMSAKRVELITLIQNDIRLLVLFRAWLYLHVPLSFALLAAVAVHIIAVFYYR